MKRKLHEIIPIEKPTDFLNQMGILCWFEQRTSRLPKAVSRHMMRLIWDRLQYAYAPSGTFDVPGYRLVPDETRLCDEWNRARKAVLAAHRRKDTPQ